MATIRELRKAKHWNQTELAAFAGVSHPAVCRAEKGKVPVYRSTLIRICAALEIDPSEITGTIIYDPDLRRTSQK